MSSHKHNLLCSNTLPHCYLMLTWYNSTSNPVFLILKWSGFTLLKIILNWKSLKHLYVTRAAAAAAAASLQSCPTLCDPRDGSPPGSPIPGILQARTLEWDAISFSSAWKWKVKVKSLSRVRLLMTPWTAAHQAPPSMGFSRQEYWSGVPLRVGLLRKLSTKELMLLNCGVGEDSWESLGL